MEHSAFREQFHFPSFINLKIPPFYGMHHHTGFFYKSRVLNTEDILCFLCLVVNAVSLFSTQGSTEVSLYAVCQKKLVAGLLPISLAIYISPWEGVSSFEALFFFWVDKVHWCSVECECVYPINLSVSWSCSGSSAFTNLIGCILWK